MFEQHVTTMKASADNPPYILMDAIKLGRIRGVILECRGAGNIPDRKWDIDGESYSWIDAIKAATDKGIHVGILSPFEDGRVNLERYELGVKAKAAGALSLESLTPAMADVKFRQAIAMFPQDPKRIQAYLSTNVVGELLPGFEVEDDEVLPTPPKMRSRQKKKLANTAEKE
jgi:L-asparaginase/Glu-tRNA(Gln) amidotransferase subunit D